MTFGMAIREAFRKYSQFEGRATRPEFWWWVLFVALVTSALGLFSVVPLGEGDLGTLLSGIWWIVVVLPSLAVAVRRLRDAGHHAWSLLVLLVPVAGQVVVAMLCCQPTRPEGAPPEPAVLPQD
ncbi:MAG: DUF805 domain-containing protein [Dermatophilaceae bacterium]